MRLHAFNAKKEYQKLMFKRNKGKYIKYGTIILSVCLLIFAIMYFSFSKFSTTKKFNVINAKVGDFSSGDYTIAAYIDGTKTSTIPLKTDGYNIDKVECSNDAVGSWDSDKWGITIINATVSGTRCNVYFTTGKSYDYTGSEQTFTLSFTGYYQLETWGAQGSSSTNSGYGSYSSGIVSLTKGDILYVYVGGNNGYNGGGSSGSLGYGSAGNGGGATHIAKSTGLLSSLSSKNADILIVSGGGGGEASRSYSSVGIAKGGNAGGYIGNSGENGTTSSSSFTIAYGGKGGTQTAGGEYSICGYYYVCGGDCSGYNGSSGGFGYGNTGGNGANSKTSCDGGIVSYSGGRGGGGGSGYYGGAGGSGGAGSNISGNSSTGSGGGGGSGYIGNTLLLSSNTVTKHMTC